MDAVVYTTDGQAYEMLAGILKVESQKLAFDFIGRPLEGTRFRAAVSVKGMFQNGGKQGGMEQYGKG